METTLPPNDLQQYNSWCCHRPDSYQRTSSTDTNKTSTSTTSTNSSTSRFCKTPITITTFTATPVLITATSSDDSTVRATGGSSNSSSGAGTGIGQKANTSTSPCVLIAPPSQQQHTRQPASRYSNHDWTSTHLSPTSVADYHQRPEVYRYNMVDGGANYNCNHINNNNRYSDNSTNNDDDADDDFSMATAASDKSLHEDLLLPTPTYLVMPTMTHQYVNLRPRYGNHTSTKTAATTSSKKNKMKNALHRSCDVAGMLNMIRIQHCLHPLERCTELDYCAKIHCRNMISACSVHSSVATVTELKIKLSSVHAGENIQRIRSDSSDAARGNSGSGTNKDVAQSMFETWMNVPINRQNILSKQFTQYGSTIEMGTDGKYYCCQLFRTR